MNPRRRRLAAALAPTMLFGACLAQGAAGDYARIPRGELRSVLPAASGRATQAVPAFQLRRLPVTNGEFLQFVRDHPRWQRGRVDGNLADPNYLASWAGPAELGTALRSSQPVTEVSWFAARAFCESRHARLPLWNEWERAAAADEHQADARRDAAWQARILGWYSQPTLAHPGPVGQGRPNVFGVSDLHGLIWEWVEDFNGLFVAADNRVQGDPEQLKFCGAGALSIEDRENYPSMMRLALLSSLKARSTTLNLGFRCTYDPQGRASGAMSTKAAIDLQDQDGRHLSVEPTGSPRLLTMFYASCPMACPLTIDTLRAIERALPAAERARLKVLMVSFDSRRDSPRALRALAQERRLDLSRWTLARGSPHEVRSLAALLDIPYRPLPNGGFNHASRLVLVDGHGGIIARSERFGVPDPAFIAAIRRALKSAS